MLKLQNYFYNSGLSIMQKLNESLYKEKVWLKTNGKKEIKSYWDSWETNKAPKKNPDEKTNKN